MKPRNRLSFSASASPAHAGGVGADSGEGGDEGGDHELLGVALRPVVPDEDEDEDEEELIE